MTKDIPKKKRKNPWHKRRVNKRYRELCDKIEHDPDVADKFYATQKIVGELRQSTETVIKLREGYEKIMTRHVQGDPFQGLPIENLEDLYQMEHDGYVSKPSFNDLVKANGLKKQGQDIIEQKFSLKTDAKVSQIDLVLAQIDVILKESDED